MSEPADEPTTAFANSNQICWVKFGSLWVAFIQTRKALWQARVGKIALWEMRRMVRPRRFAFLCAWPSVGRKPERSLESDELLQPSAACEAQPCPATSLRR